MDISTQLDSFRKSAYNHYLEYKKKEISLAECLQRINKDEQFIKGYAVGLMDYQHFDTDTYFYYLQKISQLGYLYRSSALSYAKEREEI